MSILLPENKAFSFLNLMVQTLHRLRERMSFVVPSVIPDPPWITNRTRRRAYRANVIQVDIRTYKVTVTERLGSYAQEYRFQSLYTSIEKRTFHSVGAAYRAGLALTQQLAQARYAWCR